MALISAAVAGILAAALVFQDRIRTLTPAGFAGVVMEKIDERSPYAADPRWNVAKSELRHLVSVGATKSDVILKINATLRLLGDEHSVLVDPVTVKEKMSAFKGDDTPRRVEVVPIDDYMYVKLPTLTEFDEAIAAKANADVSIGAAATECGVILDLRENGGGSMWKMISAIAPLVGEGRLGYFVSGDGARQAWGIRENRAFLGEKTMGVIPTYGKSMLSDVPVAVLIGRGTLSSGEVVASVFSTRSKARLFGQPTGGMADAREAFSLGDGSILFLTTAKLAGRDGVTVPGRLRPDVWISQERSEEKDLTLVAAEEWLQSGCR